MGKSDTFQSDYAAQQTELQSTRTKVVFRACTDLGGEASIIQFFSSRIIDEWKASNEELVLFLDGFDEGMLLAETWPSLLITNLENLPTERLKLRISCRPAVWPESLEARLAKLFAFEELPVFSLAALSEEHVRIAALAEHVDGIDFLSEVARKAATPFAIKPLTLVFLLRTYKVAGALPTSHIELFRENCLKLCDEVSPTRLELNQAGELTAQERFRIAKTLAGISIFCKRPFFAKTSLETLNHRESEAVDFTIVRPALAAGTTFSEYRETLDTGLFSARGEQMLGWAQQTFAEFSASEWAADVRLTTNDLWDLTTVYDGEARRIVPQLVTCAAWLSETRAGYRSRILKHDPTVLLNADESALDVKTRRTLVKHILNAIESGVPAHSLRSELYKLRHPRLARQLRPFLRGRKKHGQLRHAAILIAESCGLVELEADILRLVLNESEELWLRSAGAFSISEIGSEKGRLALRNLAFFPNEADVDDDLKGWSLYALWPKHIRAMDVLACLTAPKRQNYLGGYGSFIYKFSDTLQESLPVRELPAALEWASEFGIESSKLSHISDSIVFHAFQNIRADGVSDALAQFVVRRITQHQEVIANVGALTKKMRFRELLEKNPSERQILARAIIKAAVIAELPVFRFWSAGIFTSEDAATYTTVYAESNFGEKHFILELLEWLPLAPAVASSVRPALDKGLLPWSLMNLFFVEFGSRTEQIQRARYQQEQEFAPEPRKLLVPSAKERIEGRLRELESGDTGAWIWLACQELLLGEYENDRVDDNPDVTEMPGWEKADERTRSRIVNGAKAYALCVKPYPLDFVSTNTLPWWATAEYQALCLMLKSGTWNQIHRAESSTWERWSLIAVWYPFDRNDQRQQELIHMLSRNSGFVTGVRALLLRMKEAQTCYGIPARIISGWNESVRDLLLELAKEGNLPKPCARELLGLSCERDADSFVPYLVSRLQNGLAKHMPAPEISYWAGILLDGQPMIFWRDIWSILTDDARIELLVSLASSGSFKALKNVTDDALIQIYLLLESRYPYHDDPKHGDGAYAVGVRDQIADFRNSAFNIIKGRGLVKGIDAAISKFGYPWLKHHRTEALRVRRQLTWSPWPPPRLLSLVSERNKDVLEKPYVQFTVGILGNLAANLLFPEQMSRTERAFYTVFVMTAILFALNYRKLYRNNRSTFTFVFISVVIYLAFELVYFAFLR